MGQEQKSGKSKLLGVKSSLTILAAVIGISAGAITILNYIDSADAHDTIHISPGNGFHGPELAIDKNPVLGDVAYTLASDYLPEFKAKYGLRDLGREISSNEIDGAVNIGRDGAENSIKLHPEHHYLVYGLDSHYVIKVSFGTKSTTSISVTLIR